MTSNKNVSNTINMSDTADSNLSVLQKRKTLYENKLFAFLKDKIKSRKTLRKAEQKYNEKQTKANKNKLEDKKLDFDEIIETFNEYKDNYTRIVYECFNELFTKWNLKQINTFIKKNNSFDKIKNEIDKSKKLLFSLSDRASLTNNKTQLNKIADEAKPIRENMDDWINLRNFYQNLFLEFENEFYKERNKELEKEPIITRDRRTQSLVKARKIRKENTEKIGYSVNVLVYSILHYDVDLKSEEELNKIKEQYRRKKSSSSSRIFTTKVMIKFKR